MRLTGQSHALGLQYAQVKEHPGKALCQRLLRHEDELFQFVLALRGLFDYLAGRMRTNDICTLAEVLRFQRGLLPGQAEPEPPPLIARALHEGRCLRIVYRSRSTPEATERIVRPRKVTRERRGIYLLACCYLRQDQRLFAVDKIEAMELLDE